MKPRVAAFTDTYLPTVNGVTYTVQTWRDEWADRGGEMNVVYPDAPSHTPESGEHPVFSVRFPFYDGYRLGTPQVPESVTQADIVHAHTPFALGLAGLRLARNSDRAFVASYHTPTAEYAEYLGVTDGIERGVRSTAEAYERWFLNQADRVLVPSEQTGEHLEATVEIETPIEVVPNGVDIDTFRPVETDDFCARHELPTDRPLVGYTGRHGYEKCLDAIIDATEGMDVTVVFGGDGPARASLEERAKQADVDVRFLGFLDRDDLPAFYAALDVFAFPSPVETQGLVALEANTCGTPVVGVDSGALSDTIQAGETGCKYPHGDTEAFRSELERALDTRETLREQCLERRSAVSVTHAVDKLEAVYQTVENETEAGDATQRPTARGGRSVSTARRVVGSVFHRFRDSF
jgi:glycosyltransferase involved in cell wall biosynthesis